MTSSILARQRGIGNFEWIHCSNAPEVTDTAKVMAGMSVGDGERLASAVLDGSPLILLLPAETVSIKSVHFEDHERKLLRQTIPYTLEDESIDDIESLHFAFAPAIENTVPVAITKRSELASIIEELNDDHIELQQVSSELMYLPLRNQAWTILVEGDRWLLRYSQYQGFAMGSGSIKTALQLLLDEAEQLPAELDIYCEEDEYIAAQSLLPEMLKGVARHHDQNYWEVIAQGFREAGRSTIDLLQGEFSPRLPWGKWWQVWKVAAILVVVAIATQLITSVVELNVLENRNIALRAETEKYYRSVVPKGAVLDPERQLRRKVNALKGVNGEGFVSVFSNIAPVLASISGLKLQSMNYSEKQSEFRLTILADGFDDVETVRARLEELGMSAELTGSSTEGNNTRARLRVRG